MKGKLSVTLDQPLVRFLDSLPGESRSAKLERVLRGYRQVSQEAALRRALSAARENDAERLERLAWLRTIEADQWSE